MLLRRMGLLAAGVAVSAAVGASAQGRSSVPVMVNGSRIEGEAILLKNVGRTVVPMRALFESLGAQVEWDARERAVYAWKPDGTGVRLGLGSRDAQSMTMSADPGPRNWGHVDRTFQIDAPAMMSESRIYVPLRFAAEALKADVRYSAYEPAVYIRTEAVAGTREEEPPVAERPRRPRRESGVAALNIDLVTDGTRFDRNGRTTFDLTMTNDTGRTISIPFSSGQQFDIEVLRDNEVVWNWAHGRVFTQALIEMRLDAGEKKTYSARWDFTDNDGRRVAPGRYTVRGIVMTRDGRRQPAVEEQITVTQ
ncbi:MAG: BsuPI-related putative proteinase inhibitor [Actinomycetota bacterium]